MNLAILEVYINQYLSLENYNGNIYSYDEVDAYIDEFNRLIDMYIRKIMSITGLSEYDAIDLINEYSTGSMVSTMELYRKIKSEMNK